MIQLFLAVALPGCMDYAVTSEGEPLTEGPDGTPVLRVEPSEVYFSDVPESRSISVGNLGDGNLLLYRVGLTEDDSPFELTSLGDQELAPGEQTTLTVTSPGGLDATGAVFLETNDPQALLAEVSLFAEDLEPVLEVQPSRWDFGTLELGHSATAIVTLSNVGSDALTVESLDLWASSSELSFDPQSAVHGPLPWLVPPGATLEVSLTYVPVDEVADEGTLTVTSDDPVSGVATVVIEGDGDEVTCADAGDCTYTLTSDEAGTTGPCVDDILEIRLDGVLIFTSPDDTAGCESVVTFTGRPGQLLSFDAFDYWGNCRGLDTVWIHEPESGLSEKLTDGRLDGCNGYPGGLTWFFGAEALVPRP